MSCAACFVSSGSDKGDDGPQAHLRQAVGRIREWRRLFEADRLVARDCAAVAWIDGTRERVRFRISRDAGAGEAVALLHGV